MDRIINYTGALAQSTDLLSTNRNFLRAMGHVARGIWGAQSVAAGLEATPASPASLNFRVGPGMVTLATAVDAVAFGELGTDLTETVKIGGIDTTTTYPVVAPGAGKSVRYLVQAAFDEQDTGNAVLPYYNEADPLSEEAWSGPNNSGTAQPTIRRATVAINIKRGTEANTGSESTPAVSPGYLPLWIVTVSGGQTTVTGAHIQSHPDAPWVSKLTEKFAPIDSPVFIGNPRGPAPATSDSLATKAYVDALLNGAGVSTAADPDTVAKRTSNGSLVATSFIGKATTAGAADTATNATNAQNAVNAQNAQTAETADNATNAENAQNAQTAVTAQSATTSTTAGTANNALKLENRPGSITATADSVALRDASGNISANVFNGRATSAAYADFAERFEASEYLEPGDVVMFGGQNEICKAGYASSVFGVVSTAPAYLANAEAGNDKTHPPVAWQGRVPVKVLGPVQKFDLLVMSTVPGVAVATKDAVSSDVFGRALQDKADEGVSLVLAVVKARI